LLLGEEVSVIGIKQMGQPGANDSLAARLRRRRKELKLTLKEVADAAGLSVGFISQVERGLTAPSLSSLVSISKILGNEISEFLEQPRSEASYTKHERRKPYQIEGQELAYERISSSFPGQTIHSVIIHMPPGYRSEQISHEGEEMEFILQGSATSELEGEPMVLHAGDSLHYPSTRPHGLWNHTDKETIVLWVGTMDIFGEHLNA
jgi:transcriptional regulator with XRE-family HTH domain